jgi:hypothetical protein
MGYIIIAIALFLTALLWAFVNRNDGLSIFDPPEKQAGRRGEHIVTNIIQEILESGDVLLTNVEVEYEGQLAELDDVVINHNGIFIIEVKNYSGRIFGNEEDPVWAKYKTTPAGNTYEKNVDNPIKQVKRQVHILANYLRKNRQHVWVDGYVYFVQGNSPIESDYILENPEGIDKVLHSPEKMALSREDINHIMELLSS